MSIFEHVIFPARCPSCEATSRGICSGCRPEIESWSPTACLRCGSDRADRCFCSSLPEQVTQVQSMWRFEGPVTEIVERSKYRGELWRIEQLHQWFRGWIWGVAGQIQYPVHIVPVPSDRRARIRRGFELPTLMARWGKKRGTARLALSVLRRRSAGRSQTTLSRDERLHQMEGLLKAHAAPARVILLDDVITTGATVTACAKALAGAGSREIAIVSLARTPSAVVGDHSVPSRMSSSTFSADVSSDV